jgi:hypothetical protein
VASGGGAAVRPGGRNHVRGTGSPRARNRPLRSVASSGSGSVVAEHALAARQERQCEGKGRHLAQRCE